MGAKVSGLLHALYDPKKKQFLGRDGGGWGKLGTFYFFFYIGLAGFFCAMLAVFMALSPRDRPRYFSDSSRMRTRSNPLSPGLGFRPQPEVDKNLIVIKRGDNGDEINPYAKSLDQYLQVYYWQKDASPKQSGEGDASVSIDENQATPSKFHISNPGGCRNDTQYGYKAGKPCILVKINKVVGFIPEAGYKPSEKDAYEKVCGNQKGIGLHCQGEYAADMDNLRNLNYFSENGYHPTCGSFNPTHFPYKGKLNREDVYQAPYVWVQVNNPEPNVLINVICRIYGKNIDFDKKTGRGLTRFQIFVEDPSKKVKSDL